MAEANSEMCKIPCLSRKLHHIQFGNFFQNIFFSEDSGLFVLSALNMDPSLVVSLDTTTPTCTWV